MEEPENAEGFNFFPKIKPAFLNDYQLLFIHEAINRQYSTSKTLLDC